MNKNSLGFFIACLIVAPTLMAATSMEFYGIAHLSIDSISGTAVTNDFKIQSRSSRLGVKGEKVFKGNITGFYKFEFQIDVADDNNGDDFIKSRNMYIGLKDKSLGSLLIGRHDSAMKKAIGIKIFSDTVAEMTTVIGKDVGLYNRTNNTIYYSSPKMHAFQVLASVSTLEGDAANKSFDVQSVAVTYKTNSVYIGLANEKADAGQKGNRLTLGYTFISGHKMGIGYEDGEYATGENHKAYVVNGIIKLSDLYKLKVTYGKRTAVKDETAAGLGFVRDLGDKSELYVIYHNNKDDNTVVDNKTISLGMKYVF